MLVLSVGKVSTNKYEVLEMEFSWLKKKFILKLCSIALLLFFNAISSVNANASNPTKPGPEITNSKTLEKIVLFQDPDIRLYKNFVSKEEAEHLISIAKSRLRHSTVLKDGKSVEDNYWRTSSSAYIYKSEDPIVRAIEERACKLLGCNVAQIEPIQVVHYTKSQKYSPHYDYFIGDEIKHQGGQRKHTFLVYLNEVKEEHGGMTSFPALNMHVQPVMGAALYFDNLHKNGEGHPKTLHGGEPIITDGVEKWACNIWIREKAYNRKVVQQPRAQGKKNEAKKKVASH